MTEWLELSVQTEGQWPYLLAIPPALIFAYFAYAKTEPAVSAAVRKWVWLTRSLALVLLILLIAEPVLALLGKRAALPIVLALIDTSPSMGVEGERGLSRLEQLVGALDGDLRQTLSRCAVEAWGFSEEPYRVGLDTLSGMTSGGYGTDVTRALTSALEESSERRDVAAILLFSDGRHNLGDDPVRAASLADVPVYAFGVGGSGERFHDVRIASTEASSPVYTGQPFELRAVVRSQGQLPYGPIELVLFEDGEQLGRRELWLEPEGGPQEVAFEVTAPAPGPHFYRVVASPLNGEQSRDNNEALVHVSVFEERAHVRIATAAPNADFSFLRRALLADSTLEVSEYVPSSGSPRERSQTAAELSGIDVIAVIDPDADFLTASGLGFAVEKHVRAGGGLLFIGGVKSATAWRPDSPLAQALPFTMPAKTRFTDGESQLAISPAGRDHPALRLNPNTAGVAVAPGLPRREPWKQLPPLAGRLAGVVRPRDGAIVLLTASPTTWTTPPVGRQSAREPIVLAGRHGQGRIIAAASGGFWRLDLMSAGVGGSARTIREFWIAATKWLATRTPPGRVTASTEQFIYRAAEPVGVVAEVSDDLMRPEPAADVEVRVWQSGVNGQPGAGSGRSLRRILEPRAPGRYRAELPGMEPGEYSYRVEAQARRQLVGSHEGRFVVEGQTVESIDMTPNDPQLSEIARVSGGVHRPYREWRDVVSGLNTPPRVITDERSIALWGRTSLLTLLICLLAVEWLVRKRVGML